MKSMLFRDDFDSLKWLLIVVRRHIVLPVVWTLALGALTRTMPTTANSIFTITIRFAIILHYLATSLHKKLAGTGALPLT